MVGVFAGRPVYLRDVVTLHDGVRGVIDGPEEATTYTHLGFGPASIHSEHPNAKELEALTQKYPAVTVGVAKRKGANAVWVADSSKRSSRSFAGR